MHFNFEYLYSYDNLVKSFNRALKSNHDRYEHAWCLEHKETILIQLHQRLKDGTWEPQGFRSFYVHKPKRRLVHAPYFTDRVVHHALCNVIGRDLDQTLVSNSFACRVGKGTHQARFAAYYFASKYTYCLKGDIQHFFDSIDHKILLDRLEAQNYEPSIFRLINIIINRYHTPNCPGRGLPIGSLTSQLFANIYMSDYDRHNLDNLKSTAYVRYMDDWLAFSNSKASLNKLIVSGRNILQKDLHLSWPASKTQLAPVKSGIPFLGFQIFPTHHRLLGKSKRRGFEHLAEGRQVFMEAILGGEPEFTQTLYQLFAYWKNLTLETGQIYLIRDGLNILIKTGTSMNSDKYPIYEKIYLYNRDLLPILNRFPRQQRYLLAQDLEKAALSMITYFYRAALQPKQRLEILQEINLTLDISRSLWRLANDHKFVSNNQYGQIIEKIDEIGRMNGGWLKTCQPEELAISKPYASGLLNNAAGQ